MNPKPRALVTGATGFVGRHMTQELTERGWLVSRCDTKLGWDAFDIFNQGRHHEAIQHYELVVHAAAKSPHRAAIDSEPATHLYNAALDSAMFDWALRTGQGRILYLSSCAVLDVEQGHVLDAYGKLKAEGERAAGLARAVGHPVTVVRPFSGYGADQGVDWPFGAFLARARAHEVPFKIWGDGLQVRDWIHIDDVVRGALAVVDSGTAEPISLCTGQGTSMYSLARMMCDAVGYEPRFEFMTDKPAGVGSRLPDPRQVQMMQRYYTPKVNLLEAVQQAIAGKEVT